MNTKQTYFQEDWLQNIQYSSWLKRKDDKKVAYSAKCQKALKSYMKVKNRKNAEKSNVFLDRQRKQMTMNFRLFICQICHKFKQTKLKKLNN